MKFKAGWARQRKVVGLAITVAGALSMVGAPQAARAAEGRTSVEIERAPAANAPATTPNASSPAPSPVPSTAAPAPTSVLPTSVNATPPAPPTPTAGAAPGVAATRATEGSAPVVTGNAASATGVAVSVRPGVESSSTVPAQIRFRNDAGTAFRLVGAEFLLDGQPIRVAGTDPNALGSVRDLPVYSGHLVPGSHVITTRLQYQGRRRGPFSYVEHYKFNVENTGGFVVPERGNASFTVVSRERRGLNVPVDRRLDVTVEHE